MAIAGRRMRDRCCCCCCGGGVEVVDDAAAYLPTYLPTLLLTLPVGFNPQLLLRREGVSPALTPSLLKSPNVAPQRVMAFMVLHGQPFSFVSNLHFFYSPSPSFSEIFFFPFTDTQKHKKKKKHYTRGEPSQHSGVHAFLHKTSRNLT